MRFENGKQTIYSGKLHSGHFKKLCYGEGPIVSASGNFVAYRPIPDWTKSAPTQKPMEVVEIQTGKVMPFTAIPKDLAFPQMDIDSRQSIEGRLSIENYKYYGALFFHPPNGVPFRLTPEKMFVNSPPIWIGRTGEALFVGTYDLTGFFKGLFFGHDPDDFDAGPGEVYLIKPEERDWAHASRRVWTSVLVMPGEQVSCSH